MIALLAPLVLRGRRLARRRLARRRPTAMRRGAAVAASVASGAAASGNGVRLRSEPPMIAGAAATGSRLTPISRAVGCSLISRGSDAASYSRHEFTIAIAAVSRCDLAPRLGIDACDVLGTPMIELIGPVACRVGVPDRAKPRNVRPKYPTSSSRKAHNPL